MNSLEEKFKYLEQIGFKVPKHRVIKVKDVPAVYKEFIEKRPNLEYDIDGLVISIDDVEKMESLGVLNEKGKPRGQIALKFPPNKNFTKVLGVVYSYKGTQDISMVAKIQPVEIDGTIVKRASLKSYRWVKENKVGIGSIVEIVKGGDIIPKIVRAVTSYTIDFERPINCYYCGAEIFEGEAQLYCSNEYCHAKVAARISKFLKCLGVKGLAWKSLLEYSYCGINLLWFVSKEWDNIENIIEVKRNISKVIWNKVRKQLEEK